MNANADAVLETLRARLDGIDEELLDRVRRRFECCVDIAHYKREHGVPMMQPDRVRRVHDRAARYGAVHGIDEVFLRRLYQLIVDEACRVEDVVIAGGAHPRCFSGERTEGA